MSDIYTPYETGLRALLERLGHDHVRYDEALVYQHRLTENIKAARRYGDTETRRAERAEIVDRLNGLALDSLGVSYSALCRSEEGAQDTAPPLGEATTRIDTGGGAYVAGNVTVQGGDFVGQDQTNTKSTKKEVGRVSIPADYYPRPTVPTEGQPLALIAAALEARRLLLVWAEAPFPPEERPSEPEALLINRWRREADALPPFPWPVHQLPPLTILSLDPSDRIEAAFRAADVPLNVLCTRQDVIVPDQHNLIKLTGDLASRSGLLLTWADVRDVSNNPDKVHLLEEVRRVARDGVVLMISDAPDEQSVQLWNELVRAYASDVRHRFALGPTGFAWPEPLTRLGGKAEEVLSVLADVVIPPPLEPVEAESLRRQLAAARENLRLIEERKSEYVMSTEVPLQLVKEERRLRERIAALERQLGPGPEGDVL